MLLALASLALTPFPAPQGTVFDLADPAGEQDVVFLRNVFDPSGGSFYTAFENGDIARLEIATGAREVVASVGWSPYAMAITPSGPTLVMADQGSELRLIDLATSTTQAITEGVFYGEKGLLVDTQGARAVLYSKCGLNDVSVFDLAAGVLEREFALDGETTCFADKVLAADDQTLVSTTEDRVWAYDLTTGTAVGDVPVPTPVGGQIEFLVASEDRTRAFAVAMSDAQTIVTRLDLPALTGSASLTVPGAVRLGGVNESVAVDDTGERAIVATDGGVHLLDFGLGTTFTIPTPDGSFDVGMAHDGSRSWFFDGLTAEVVVLDAGGAILDRWPARYGSAGFGPRSPVADTFVLGRGERRQILDLLPNGSVVQDVPVSPGLDFDGEAAFAVAPDGRRAAVVGSESDAVWMLDLVSGDVVRTARTDADPYAVRYAADGRLLIAHRAGQALTEYDPTTGAVLARTPLPGRAIELWPGATAGFVWCLVIDDATRRLVRIDRAQNVVDRTFDLRSDGVIFPGEGAALRVLTRHIHVDAVRGRALVLHPSLGLVEMIDLASGVVVAAASTPGVATSFDSNQFLVPTPDGSCVAVGCPEGTLVLDVGPNALTPRWERADVRAPSGWIGAGAVLAAYMDLPIGAETFFDGATGVALPFTLDGSSANVGFSVGGTYGGDAFLATQDVPVNAAYGAAFAAAHWDAAAGVVDARTITMPAVPPAAYVVPSVATSLGLPDAVAAEGESPHVVVLDPAGPTAQRACSPAPSNAIGERARIDAFGLFFAGGKLSLRTSGLEPLGMPSMVLVATAFGPPRPVLASGRSLCVSGSIGRWVGSLGLANAAGTRVVELDLDALPIPGYGAAFPGDSLTFQTWYRDRDAGGVATDNASDALTVTLR